MKTVSTTELRRLNRRAVESPRGRINRNMHPSLEDPIQRFFNCIEPGSYVRPHRHTDPPRWEVFLALRGSACVVEFSDDGTVLERTEISPDGPDIAVEIPGGSWHTVAALATGTTLFELKPGPYSPISDKDFALWAPAEDHGSRSRFLHWLRTARPGDRPTTNPEP
jgi:cupin fold WbuC family metalloprotein